MLLGDQPDRGGEHRRIIGEAEHRHHVGDEIERQDEIGDRAEQRDLHMARRLLVEGAVIGREQILGERQFGRHPLQLDPETPAHALAVLREAIGRLEASLKSDAMMASLPAVPSDAPARPIAAADHRPRVGDWRTRRTARRQIRPTPSAAGDRVHRLGEFDIPGGDAAGVMGRQHHLHGLVDVAPFRMMIVLFRHQRHAGHEAEGLVEIPENEGLGDRVAPATSAHPGKPCQGRFPCLRRQSLRHVDLRSSAELYPDTRHNGNHDADVTSGQQEICYNIVPIAICKMNLSLKRLFARSMTGGIRAERRPPSPRSSARRAVLVTLAAVLAIVGSVVAGYYFAMRPVTLKIAVGPPNSDDVKVVQTLTQAFVQHRSYVRLKPLQTDGAVASAEDLAQGKVDLAIIRGDLDVPKNAQAVATLRKNFVVLWVPPPMEGQEGRSEDHQD